MFKMESFDAKKLEDLVCKVFDCKYGGIAGLVTATHFENYPLDAAIFIVSYIYAKKLNSSDNQYSDFLTKYNTIFSYPDENDAEHEMKNYIKELTKIVESINCR